MIQLCGKMENWLTDPGIGCVFMSMCVCLLCVFVVYVLCECMLFEREGSSKIQNINLKEKFLSICVIVVIHIN